MKYKKIKLIFLVTIPCLCVLLFILNYFFIFRLSTTSLENQKYGVIDGNISTEYENVVYNNQVLEEESKTHGDYLLKFISALYSDYTIYYYNAALDGKITDKTIIEGLEWMKDNGIKNVNISLSSKKYSEDLQNWILENKNDIKIYASYSNEKNTYDYPAMYEGVIGSTGLNDNPLKDYDISYSNYNVVDVCNLDYYKGNSYLSLISMFQK